MNAKPHRQNSGFQLRHFLVGGCSTPDGAYVLMYGQLIDMKSKVKHAESQRKRQQAKRAKCEHIINRPDEFKTYEILDAEADLLELEADSQTWDMNFEAAKQELTDIENLMLELKPLCKFAHLSILEMSEASQEEEWLGELKQRAENFLITAGTIPHDHFQTMRMHPQFKTELVSHIQNIQSTLSTVGLIETDQQGKPTGRRLGPADHAEVMRGLNNVQLLAAPKEN